MESTATNVSFLSLEDAVTEAFRANPRVTVILTRIGQGYNRARYSGRCPLTGLTITAGVDYIRRIEGVTRSGRSFDVTSTQEALKTLESRHQMRRTVYTSDRGAVELLMFFWTKATEGWVELLKQRIEGANPRSTISLVIQRPGQQVPSVVTYTRWAKTWACPRGRVVTTAHMLATFRRMQHAKLWYVTRTDRDGRRIVSDVADG